MNNLLEQWNEHTIKGNQLSRELEDFEGIMHVADMSNSMIAIYDGAGTTFIGKVLSPEKMEEIKQIVVTALTEAKLTKEVELEKLMGKKPAYINPTFEAAVQKMEQSAKKPDPVKADPVLKRKEMTLEEVKRLYQDEGKSQGYIADHFGVKKSEVNTFLQKHKLFRNRYSKKDDGFLDAKVEQRRKERP